MSQQQVMEKQQMTEELKECTYVLCGECINYYMEYNGDSGYECNACWFYKEFKIDHPAVKFSPERLRYHIVTHKKPVDVVMTLLNEFCGLTDSIENLEAYVEDLRVPKEDHMLFRILTPKRLQRYNYDLQCHEDDEDDEDIV